MNVHRTFNESIPYHTIPYHTIPYHTIPYHTIPYHTIPYHTIPYHTIPYHTIPYHTIPYHTIPYHTIPYHTIPYHTIPYHTISLGTCEAGLDPLRHPQIADRRRSRSRTQEEEALGIEKSANLAALMARAENAREGSQKHLQRVLDESQLPGWEMWLKHAAADVIPDQEAALLVAEGAEEVGTQWRSTSTRTGRFEARRSRQGCAEHVPMQAKSRLVAMGKPERREVSPTADTEGIHLAISFASSRKAKVQCRDSAYFTGERLSRVLLLRQPRSGLPGLQPLRPLVGTRTCVRNTGCRARVLEVPPHIAWRRCQRKPSAASSVHTDR